MKPPRDRPTPKTTVTAEANDSNELETRREMNGDHRPSMHPAAVEALAVETAARQSADEKWITDVDEGVKELRSVVGEFREGKTPWQQEMRAALATVANEVHILKVERAVRPWLLAFIILFLGGFCAELVARIASH